MAKRLVDARPFKNLEDVTRVSGVSMALIGEWKGKAMVGADDQA